MWLCFCRCRGFSELAKSLMGLEGPDGKRQVASLDSVVMRLLSELIKRQGKAVSHPSWSHYHLTKCCPQFLQRTSLQKHQQVTLQSCESGDGVREGGMGPGTPTQKLSSCCCPHRAGPVLDRPCKRQTKPENLGSLFYFYFTLKINLV